MNPFSDTHIAWDCTAPSCAYGIQALSRSRGKLGKKCDLQLKEGYMYSYDPTGDTTTGLNLQLHWYYASPGFELQGVIEPFCLKASEYGTYSRPLQLDLNTLPANPTQSLETSTNTSY